VELLPERDAHERQRQPPEHACEDLRGLAVGELAASDLELDADELIRPGEGERESPGQAE
jgi:hypothetical protein